MRILLILCLFVGSVHVLPAQTKPAAKATATATVPDEVQQSFKTLYPGVESPTWSLKKQQWLAQFPVKGVRTRARFRDDGTLVGVRRYLKPEQLPAPIRTAALKSHNGYRISWASEWVPNGGQPTHYLVYLNKQGADAKVALQNDGTPLEMNKIPEAARLDAEDADDGQ